MAQLKNKWAFNQDTKGELITVGHNRQVNTTETVSECFLHGNMVVLYNHVTGLIHLNTHGYKTTTTRQAMCDFLSALLVGGNVSFAKGQFTANIGGKIYKTDEYDLVVPGMN